jgi:hypothetical protein
MSQRLRIWADMRWQRPRRGSELTWLEDPIQGDSWLVLASKPAPPLASAGLSFLPGPSPLTGPLQVSSALTGPLPQLAHLPLSDTEVFETNKTAGLALRLALAEPTREGMTDWVQRYGLFTNTSIHDGRWAGSLGAWLHTRLDARWLVAAWFEDAPDVPHAAKLRETFLDEPTGPRESAVTVLRRLLRANKTEMDLIGNELWPAGPTFEAQMWGELAVRIATARPFALCAKCGGPFVFQRATSMYCSNTCRVMASRERVTVEPTPRERARRLLEWLDLELHDAARERLPGPAVLSENRAALAAIAAGKKKYFSELPRLELIIAEEQGLLELRRAAQDLVTSRPKARRRQDEQTRVGKAATKLRAT